jgi:lipoate-protein ligase A
VAAASEAEAGPAIAPYHRDDALLSRTGDGPRAEVYRCQEVAVVLGRGSRAEIETDLAAVAADRVPLLRRRGGGCAVVLDPGNLVVSVALAWPGLGAVRAAYDAITAWLIEGLAAAGVAGVERRGSSDLALGERKIGGACMHRSRDLVYYSTTLLHSPDLDRIERYLPHPPREPDYRRGRAHRAFLGALAGAGADRDPDRLAAALRAALASRPLAGTAIAVA